MFGQRKSAALAEYAFFLLNPLIPHVLTIEEGAGTRRRRADRRRPAGSPARDHLPAVRAPDG